MGIRVVRVGRSGGAAGRMVGGVVRVVGVGDIVVFVG